MKGRKGGKLYAFLSSKTVHQPTAKENLYLVQSRQVLFFLLTFEVASSHQGSYQLSDSSTCSCIDRQQTHQ